MGCRTLTDGDYACFYDSITMTAFGPVMDSPEEADGFLKWCEEKYSLDPRELTSDALMLAYGQFRKVWCEDCACYPCECSPVDGDYTEGDRQAAIAAGK